MTNNYVNIFTQGAVKPAQVSYQAITMAANLALLWPTESLEGSTYVASQIDVTATAGSLSLAMPNALAGSTGPATIIANIGANSFTVTDSAGGSIAVIASSQAWMITLTSNATAAGAWRALQMASTTSIGQASALADNRTIQVDGGTTLQTFQPTNLLTTNANLVATTRGSLNILQVGSGAATFTLDTIANLTAGWWCDVENQTVANAITLATTAGATINGAAGFTVNPGSAVRIVCAAGGFNVTGSTLLTQYGVVLGGGVSGTPTNVSGLGAVGQILTSAGPGVPPTWQSSTGGFVKIIQQIITSTGTYTPSPNLQYCIVEICAGGAGGQTPTAQPTGGGGGGEYARGVFTAAQIGASQSVTIGPGGTVGVNGSPTLFGAAGVLLNAVGGSVSTLNQYPGGVGGTGGTGSGLHLTGGNGGAAFELTSASWNGGYGGASYFGFQAVFSSIGVTSTSTLYGNGGTSGFTNSVGPSFGIGGGGAPGVAIITEFTT